MSSSCPDPLRIWHPRLIPQRWAGRWDREMLRGLKGADGCGVTLTSEEKPKIPSLQAVPNGAPSLPACPVKPVSLPLYCMSQAVYTGISAEALEHWRIQGSLLLLLFLNTHMATELFFLPWELQPHRAASCFPVLAWGPASDFHWKSQRLKAMP